MFRLRIRGKVAKRESWPHHRQTDVSSLLASRMGWLAKELSRSTGAARIVITWHVCSSSICTSAQASLLIERTRESRLFSRRITVVLSEHVVYKNHIRLQQTHIVYRFHLSNSRSSCSWHLVTPNNASLCDWIPWEFIMKWFAPRFGGPVGANSEV